MTKEELEKEAREYLAEHSKYSEVFGEFFVAVDTLTAMLDFAEPREKQIEIDAEQIRALQKQNGELTDKVKELEAQINRAFDILSFKRKRIAELEAQIEKMKCCGNCTKGNCVNIGQKGKACAYWTSDKLRR